MKYAWLVIGIYATRFVTVAIAFPSGDGDLAWQRWLGASVLRTHSLPRFVGRESFTADGAGWVPQEWAFSLAAYFGQSPFGWNLFAGGVAFAASASLAIAAYQAHRRGAAPYAVAVCTGLAAVAMNESFGVRAQVVAWPLIALFLLVIDIDGPWAFVAVGVAALWSNIHASAMLAPVISFVAACGAAVDEGPFGRRSRRLLAIAFGSLAAICLNPLGWDLPKYAIGLFENPIKSYIDEWHVTNLGDASFAFGALPLLLVVLVSSTHGSNRRWSDAFIICTFAALMLLAARNIAVFGLVALPIVAPALSRSFAWLRFSDVRPALQKDAKRARVVLVAVSAVLAIAVGVQLLRTIPRDSNQSAGPLAMLAGSGGGHRLFCEDFAWCSRALGMANVRVFSDGRADAYPLAVWRDSASISSLASSWRTVLDQRRIDAILVSKGAPLDQALAAAGQWRARYADKDLRLWMRPPLREAGRELSERE